MSASHLPALAREAVRVHQEHPFQRIERYGEWHTTTYAQFGTLVDRFAGALVESGLRPDDRVAICAHNCPEWTVADVGILTAGCVTVSVFTTSPPAQIAHVLNDSGARVLFVGGQQELAPVLKVWSDCPALEFIVVLDGSRGAGGARCLAWEEFLTRCPPDGHREQLDQRQGELGRDTLATLIYTPGTTGESKGVMLTHGNVLSQVSVIEQEFTLYQGDRTVCFLPLAHAYERMWSFMVIHFGMEYVYIPDPHQVMSVIRRVRPHAFVSTPRLYHKVHEAIEHRIGATPTGQAGYEWAVGVGVEVQRARMRGASVPLTQRLQHAIADRLVLRHVRDAVGGPKRLLSCGGAALSPRACELFFAAGVPIYHGYGQIETSSMATCNTPTELTFDTVGKPVRGCQIRVAANGEILVRGSNVMLGYYNRSVETAAVLDGGWFRTGDMGHLTRDGALVVTDRLVDLIVTAHGTTVAPQPLESALTAHPFVERAVVIGENRQYLTAIIQPTYRALEQHANRQGWRFASRGELLNHPRIQGIFTRLVHDVGVGLDAHVRLRQFRLLEEELSEEHGDLTPTLGIKRSAVEFRYGDLIEQMYNEPA